MGIFIFKSNAGFLIQFVALLSKIWRKRLTLIMGKSSLGLSAKRSSAELLTTVKRIFFGLQELGVWSKSSIRCSPQYRLSGVGI